MSTNRFGSAGQGAIALAVLFLGAPAPAGTMTYEDEASFLGALSTPLHEDFDAFASGTMITALPSVLVSGVSGMSGTGVPVDQFVTAQDDLPFGMLAGQDTSSPPNLFSNDLSAGGGFATGEITFAFESAMNAIGFYVADGAPLGTFRIDLYSEGGLVASVSSSTPRTLPDSFFGVSSLISFDEATFGSNSELDSWGIDDLYVQAVPVPGAVAIFGLFGLMGTRRRRT